MAEPQFTPKSGIGTKYVDPATKKQYVFTNSGWKPMSIDIQTETQDKNTFVVKPEEKEIETKLLQGGANRENVLRTLNERRRIKANIDTKKQLNPEKQTTDTKDVFNKKDASNPFGTVSKQQFIRQAFNAGVHDTGELKKLGDIFDMVVAPDTGVLDETTMGIADSLRAEYFKRSTENGYLEIKNAYEKVVAASPSAEGDIALIFSFMKLLDPGSVVREGEFATAENAAGVPERIRRKWNKVLKGDKLDQNLRDSYKQEAKKQFAVYQRRQEPIDMYYAGLAGKYGVDPSLVGVGLYDVGDVNNVDPLNLENIRASDSNPLGI